MSLLDTFRERRPFPGQDPWIVPHEGSLLLVQSAGGNRRLVVRRFRDLDHMERNSETVIWTPKGAGAGRQLWAPELHHLDGRWYVYFAASDGKMANHRSHVLVADDPLGRYEYLGPVHDPLHDVWSIDLTVFTHEERLYAVWSGWEDAADGFPQNLYIAPMSDPATISGERRRLSTPEHDWEKSVAPVNEGPEVIRHPETGRLFLLYSADASWTPAYKMGLLAWTGGEVTDPGSWEKQELPWFVGGGHGCLVDTPTGSHFVYHRKVTDEWGWADREIRSTPLTWDDADFPVAGPGLAAAAGQRTGLVAVPTSA